MDDYSWVCNECGAKEFTSAISEDDLEWLSCGSCGCPDFHKEDKFGNLENAAHIAD